MVLWHWAGSATSAKRGRPLEKRGQGSKGPPAIQGLFPENGQLQARILTRIGAICVSRCEGDDSWAPTPLRPLCGSYL